MQGGISVRALKDLIYDFWEWTQVPEQEYGKVDIRELAIDPTIEYPKIDEISELCIQMINTPLDATELDLFLMGMALDSEGEYILSCCIEEASDSFLYEIVSAGISFPQAETRWQVAELLRKDIPGREQYLQALVADSDSYVRKRARNVALDNPII